MQSVVSSSLGHCYDLYLNEICLKYAKVLRETVLVFRCLLHGTMSVTILAC